MSEDSNPFVDDLAYHSTPLTKLANEDQQELYQYVAMHGPVEKTKLRDTVFPHDRRALCHHLALLKQRGYLVETDGAVDVVQTPDTLCRRREYELADESILTVRPAETCEREALLAVLEDVAETDDFAEAAVLASRLSEDECLFRDEGNETRIIFVAMLDGSLRGWAHISSLSHWSRTHIGWSTCGVVEPYRRRGIGAHLLTYYLDWARSRNFVKLYQMVSEANQSGIEYLKRQGWSVECVLSDHYAVGDDYMDEVLLTTDLRTDSTDP